MESDEWATVETVDDGVESVTYNSRNGPSGVDQGIFEKVITTVALINPWYILLLAVSLYYLWQKFSPSISRASTTSYPPQSPDEILARQEAQEAARRRMQELYDEKAREAAIKQKEKEELKRQEKLKNMEKYGSAFGKSGRTLAAEASSSSQQEEQLLPKKKPTKSNLRPEYNPLMGGGGGCFRPARRGGGAGGG